MISTDVKDIFYPKENPVGKIIEIRGQPYKLLVFINLIMVLWV